MNNPDILHISLDDNGWYIVDEVGDESTTKWHSDAKYKALEARIDELLKSIEGKLDDEAYGLGALDGYDYDSGVEYGLRKAAIIVRNARIDK